MVNVVSVMAWIIVELPKKMLSLSATAEIGKRAGSITVMLVESETIQVSPIGFTVEIATVYAVDEAGLAVGLAIVELFKPEDGDQL
jgi:hypothetical protein